MAGIQLISAGGITNGGREEARAPLQASTTPYGVNYYRYAGFTGTLGAALAANVEVMQFRFVSGTKTFALVHKIIFDGMGIVVAPTVAGPMGFHVTPARGWTVAGSGGTRIVNTGNNMKMETASATSQVTDIGIATTAGLTAGTKTFDANSVGQALGGIGTVALTGYGPTGFIPPQPLYNMEEAGMPLVLANQEGFSIRTTHAGLATMTYAAGFTIQWSEVQTF